MKNINLVDLELDIDTESIDADDYGHRLTECISQVIDSEKVVNLVKIKLGERVSKEKLQNILLPIQRDLQEMGATNCVYVPIIKGYIEDIAVDHVEVKYDTNC